MSGYLLDTRGDWPEKGRRLASLPMEEMTVTEADCPYGLAGRSYPAMLAERVGQFLLRVDVLARDRDVTRAYADQGLPMSVL
jgi:hypothetical protein